jgi:hypothetical protein
VVVHEEAEFPPSRSWQGAVGQAVTETCCVVRCEPVPELLLDALLGHPA